MNVAQIAIIGKGFTIREARKRNVILCRKNNLLIGFSFPCSVISSPLQQQQQQQQQQSHACVSSSIDCAAHDCKGIDFAPQIRVQLHRVGQIRQRTQGHDIKSSSVFVCVINDRLRGEHFLGRVGEPWVSDRETS